MKFLDRVFCLACFWLALPASCGWADFDLTPSSFQLLAVHPDAITQATPRGQTIAALTAYNGQIFAGYGDWAQDTGPIVLRGLNPTSGAWSDPMITVGTEALSHFRNIGGQLYSPTVDPLGLPGVNPGGFVRGSASGNTVDWAQMASTPATHVFDVNSYGANELWMVGSVTVQGAIWRSTDGGGSFVPVRMDNVAAGAPDFAFARYTGIAELNGNLYTQRVDINTVHHAQSLVYDGSNWVAGPDLVPGTDGFMWHPSNFDGKLVYLDGDKSLGNLFRFDGTQAEIAFGEMVRDYYIEGDTLYALTESGKLISSTDLLTWTNMGDAPLSARSLAVYGGDIFLGTSDASVLKTISPVLIAVPEPSSIALVGLLTVTTVVLVRRKMQSRRRTQISRSHDE